MHCPIQFTRIHCCYLFIRFMDLFINLPILRRDSIHFIHSRTKMTSPMCLCSEVAQKKCNSIKRLILLESWCTFNSEINRKPKKIHAVVILFFCVFYYAEIENVIHFDWLNWFKLNQIITQHNKTFFVQNWKLTRVTSNSKGYSENLGFVLGFESDWWRI